MVLQFEPWIDLIKFWRTVNTRHAMGTGRMPDDPRLGEYLSPEDVAEAVIFAVTQPLKSRLFMLGMRPLNESLFD